MCIQKSFTFCLILFCIYSISNFSFINIIYECWGIGNPVKIEWLYIIQIVTESLSTVIIWFNLNVSFLRSNDSNYHSQRWRIEKGGGGFLAIHLPTYFMETFVKNRIKFGQKWTNYINLEPQRSAFSSVTNNLLLVEFKFFLSYYALL